MHQGQPTRIGNEFGHLQVVAGAKLYKSSKCESLPGHEWRSSPPSTKCIPRDQSQWTEEVIQKIQAWGKSQRPFIGSVRSSQLVASEIRTHIADAKEVQSDGSGIAFEHTRRWRLSKISRRLAAVWFASQQKGKVARPRVGAAFPFSTISHSYFFFPLAPQKS